MLLARAAARAGQVGGPSLAAIAARVVDPTLIASTTGELELDVADVEELNYARNALSRSLGQNPVMEE
jgi:hypothetical protein